MSSITFVFVFEHFIYSKEIEAIHVPRIGDELSVGDEDPVKVQRVEWKLDGDKLTTEVSLWPDSEGIEGRLAKHLAENGWTKS